MKEEPPFFGIRKKIDDISHKRAKRSIEEERKKGFKPYSGEIKKTKEHIRIIELVNELLEKECVALGIETISPIPPEQIHFLPSKTYQRLEGTKSVGTYARSRREEITIDTRDTVELFELFRTVAHEMIHAVSFGKYGVISDALGRVKVIKATRVGYFNLGQSEEDFEYFRYLNEAVVEQMTLEMTKDQKEFSIPSNIYLLGAYIFPRAILDRIIKKIAMVEDEEYGTVWNRFKKGLLTGEMMHLRSIERIYGKRALRILSQLEGEKPFSTRFSDDEKKKHIERVTAMENFFQEENPIRREQLADIILGPEQKKI